MIFILGSNVFLQRLNGDTYAWCLCAYRTVYALPLLESNCEWLMVRVQNCDCVVCAGTGAANAFTKRDIENPFSGTQMYVQARNNECSQRYPNHTNLRMRSDVLSCPRVSHLHRNTDSAWYDRFPLPPTLHWNDPNLRVFSPLFSVVEIIFVDERGVTRGV